MSTCMLCVTGMHYCFGCGNTVNHQAEMYCLACQKGLEVDQRNNTMNSTKFEYAKTLEPVKVTRKYWTLTRETAFGKTYEQEFGVKPNAIQLGDFVRMVRAEHVGFVIDYIYLNEYQTLTNGDIWIQKKLQGKVTDNG